MVGGLLKCFLGGGKSPDLAKACGDCPGRWSRVLGAGVPWGTRAFRACVRRSAVGGKGPDLGRKVGSGGPWRCRGGRACGVTVEGGSCW